MVVTGCFRSVKADVKESVVGATCNEVITVTMKRREKEKKGVFQLAKSYLTLLQR